MRSSAVSPAPTPSSTGGPSKTASPRAASRSPPARPWSAARRSPDAATAADSPQPLPAAASSPRRDGGAAVLRSDEADAVRVHFLRCVAEQPVMLTAPSLVAFATGAGVPLDVARAVVPRFVAAVQHDRSCRGAGADGRGEASMSRVSMDLSQALELIGRCKVEFEATATDPDAEDARNALAALRTAAEQHRADVAAASSQRGGAALGESARLASGSDRAESSMADSASVRADSRLAARRAAKETQRLGEAARYLAGVDSATVADIIETSASGSPLAARDGALGGSTFANDAEVERALVPRRAPDDVVRAMRQLGAWYDADTEDWVLPLARVLQHGAVPAAFLEEEALCVGDVIDSAQFERLVQLARAEDAASSAQPAVNASPSSTVLMPSDTNVASSAGLGSFHGVEDLSNGQTAAGTAASGTRTLRQQQQQQPPVRPATYGAQTSTVRMADLLAGLDGSSAFDGADRLRHEAVELERRHATRIGSHQEPRIPRHASPYNTRAEPAPPPVETHVAQRHALRSAGPRSAARRSGSASRPGTAGTRVGCPGAGQRTQPSSPKEPSSAPLTAGGRRPDSGPEGASKRGASPPHSARSVAVVPAHAAGQYRVGAAPVPHYRAATYADMPMLRGGGPSRHSPHRQPRPAAAPPDDAPPPQMRPETPPRRAPSREGVSPRPVPVSYRDGSSTPVIDLRGHRGRHASPQSSPANGIGSMDAGASPAATQLRVVYVTDEHGNRQRHFLVPAPSVLSRNESPAPPTVGRPRGRPEPPLPHSSDGASRSASRSHGDFAIGAAAVASAHGPRAPSAASSRYSSGADYRRSPAAPHATIDQPIFVGSATRSSSRLSPTVPAVEPSNDELVIAEEPARHADEEADVVIEDEVLVAEMRARRAARYIQVKFKSWRARLRTTNAYTLQRIGRAFIDRRLVAQIPVVIKETGERKVRTRRAVMLVMRLQAVGRGALDRAALGDRFGGFAENRALDDFVSLCGLTRVGRATTTAPPSAAFERLQMRERRRALPVEETRARHDEEFAEEMRAGDDDELADFDFSRSTAL